MSVLSKVALEHLNYMKPYDGWSTHSYKGSDGKSLLLLRRRNVPLSDSGFDDIVYDKRTGTIVGIMQSSLSASGTRKKGVILVDKDGIISRRKQVIEVDIARETSDAPSSSNRHSSNTISTSSSITSEQNKQILQYGGGVLLSAILL